jgi:hypothetical protein
MEGMTARGVLSGLGCPPADIAYISSKVAHGESLVRAKILLPSASCVHKKVVSSMRLGN